MGTKTKIPWCDMTINPIVGCSKCSPGCDKRPEDAIHAEIKNGRILIDEYGKFWKKSKAGLVRAENKTGLGYLQVRKMVGGKRYHASAHRVAWEHFNNSIIPDGMVINHRNGQKADNRPCNLELTTYSDNQKHAMRHGLRDQFGERNPVHKLSDKQVAEIRLAYSQGGYTQEQIGRKYGVAYQTVSNIVRGKRRTRQLGVVGEYSHRRQFPILRDKATGRILGKDPLLDSREWKESPPEATP